MVVLTGKEKVDLKDKSQQSVSGIEKREGNDQDKGFHKKLYFAGKQNWLGGMAYWF